MSKDLENVDVEIEENAIDFFSDDNIEVIVDEPKPKDKDKDKKPVNLDEEEEEDIDDPASKKGKDDEEEEEDIDFFGGSDDEEEDDEEGKKKKAAASADEDDEEDDVNESSTIKTLNFLKEKGLLEFELEDGEELTEERAEELLEDSYDSSVEKAIEEKLKDLPKPIKELNKFVLNGGDPAQFLSSLAQSSTSKIKPGLDLENEANQELVMRESLKADGYDDEYIDTQIDFLKDSKKLDKIAEKRYTKWEKDNEAAQASLAQQQAAARQKRKDNIRESKKAVSKMLSTNPEINDIKFDKKDIKEMPDYMFEPAYKLDNGREITEMEKDLMESMKDQNKMAVLAKMLKSNFDFESFKKDASDEVTKKVKSNLRRQKTGGAGKVKKTGASKSLADYFD